MSAPDPRVVLGNTALADFDVLVIGSGAGGAAVTELLARHGKNVVVLEAGSNHFTGLDDPDPAALGTLFSNDEIKFRRRFFLETDPLVEPRTYRSSESDGPRSYVGDVNLLPKNVGGAAVHSNLTTVRFQPFDFELASRMTELPGGTSFADWPLAYAELEPFYLYAERTLGVQGDARDNPFEPPRSGPYPMGPGPDMAIGYMLAEAATRRGYHPYLAPHAICSEPYDGRPACAGCGFCGEYGCPINAKGSPAVTHLRKALLTGRVQLRCETRAVRLLTSASGRDIRGVEALGPTGERLELRAGRYVLAASAIEDARLLALSGDGAPIGNSSGLVGRNLMFHFLTTVAGVFDQRLHGHRGKTVSMGFADFRGRPDDPERPLGGLVLAGATGNPIDEALNYATRLRLRGARLAAWLQQSPLRDRLMGLSMYSEDAPQPSNRVDLDPEVRDLDGLPVARVTYENHAFELEARAAYAPKMAALLEEAGAVQLLPAFGFKPSRSRHIMGTLRCGTDSRTSVCNRHGRFHDIGNLYAADGSLFPTSSGYNPILTTSAIGSWVGASMLSPESPARRLPS